MFLKQSFFGPDLKTMKSKHINRRTTTKMSLSVFALVYATLFLKRIQQHSSYALYVTSWQLF